jgi:probable HAF family extracellular repeat protein
VLAGACLLAASGALAQPASIVSVGVLPGTTTGNYSTADAVSADGSVVVGTSNYRAYRWTALGGMQDLGVLSGGTNSYGRAVNADGSVVVVRSQSPQGTFGARWTAQGGLQSIGVATGTTGSDGLAISADGSIIVGSSYSSTYSVNRASRWTLAGGLVGIYGGYLTDNSWANSISADGLAAAGPVGTSPNQHAFRWTQAGGMVDLGVFPGANYAYANGISADGSVVTGYGIVPVSGYRMFRWTQATGMQPLAPETYAVAQGLSRDGRVVVGWHNLDTSAAMAWSQRTGVFDLHDRLVELGVDMTGWVLQQGNAASADGHVIVGIGMLNGQGRGFVATLPPFACPADFNGSGGLTVQDIFDFLNAWFAGDPRADFNLVNGLTTQDIFDFLNEWFGGCPM